MKLNPLEFKIFRILEKYRGSHLLVAVSGGADSVTLLVLLNKLRARLDLKLTVGHVHHGRNPDSKLEHARDHARRHVRDLAEKFGLRFDANPESSLEPESQSESSMRKFRHNALEEMRLRNKADYVVLAHHSDDLFETRLIRLLRGTGPQGLRAMRIRRRNLLRPLLGISRESLRTYLSLSGFSATEDPSNADSGPLRNWLRHVWLKELELKRPGSSKALARSLSLIAESVSFSPSASRSTILMTGPEGDGIDRRLFDGLTVRQKRLALSDYLRKLDAQNMSRSQIEEVIKRLDTDRKSLMFKIGPLKWSINAQQISAGRVD